MTRPRKPEVAIAAGQIWRDRDPRFGTDVGPKGQVRYVRIGDPGDPNIGGETVTGWSWTQPGASSRDSRARSRRASESSRRCGAGSAADTSWRSR